MNEREWDRLWPSPGLVSVPRALGPVTVPEPVPEYTFTSPGEEVMWLTYDADQGRWPALAGLQPQVPVSYYALDFGRRDIRRGIEINGRCFHGEEPEWARDHIRRRRIQAAGWVLSEFTTMETMADPVGVLDEIDGIWAAVLFGR